MPTSTLTISQYTANPTAQLSSSSLLEVRGWYTRDFIAGDGVTPVFGSLSNGEQGPYYSITPTLSGGNLVVPAHIVQATTLSNPTARYFEGLWVDEAFITLLLPNTQGATGWQIPTVYGDPIAYDEIAYYNRAKRLVYPPNTYFTADQTIQEILRLAGNFDYAAVSVNGITSIYPAPIIASAPESYGTNAKNLPTKTTPVYWASQYLTFNAALTAIGASQATLIVSEAQMVATTASIPATLTLQFQGAGSLSITTGNMLTIAGPLIASPTKIFFNAVSGQGTVSFSGNDLITDWYPQWWGAVDGGTDVGSALVACVAAIDTAGAGNLMWGSNNFGSTVALVVGSAATQHKINIIGVNNVVSKLTWLGSTSAVALTLNVEKYCTVSNLRVENGVAAGTTVGIRLTGNAGSGTQTNGGILNLVLIDGFNVGLHTSNAAGATSSEISYFNFTVQNCDFGIVSSDFNAISHNFYDLQMAANTVGFQATTSQIHVWGGSASGNDDDFIFVQNGASSIIGFYSETVTNTFVTTNIGKLSIINCHVNGLSTPNSHTAINVQGGGVTIIDSLIGGQILFDQSGPTSSLTLIGNSIIDGNNTYTSAATPDLMGPGFRLLLNNGGAGCSIFVQGNTQLTNDFNTVVGSWPNGIGFATVSGTGQGIISLRLPLSVGAVLTISGNAVLATSPIHHVNDAGGLIKNISVNSTDPPTSVALIAGVTPYTTDATGNVARALTPAAGQAVQFFYDPVAAKWYPSV